MARVFITGSSDGLGLLAGRQLARAGHEVMLHARNERGMQAYTDTELHDVILAFAAARHWPDVLSNALEPGWVATKMGGPGAPDDLEAGAATLNG